MAEIVVMPKLGFNMDQGKLVMWYKKEGDSIKKGEPFFAIETDKTAIDVEATRDGVVRKLLVEEGETVPVTLPIAVIGEANEDVEAAVAEALSQLGKGGGAPKAAAPAPSAPAAPSGPAREFDVFVIGGGPGGYVAAIKAAQLGKRVALAEKDNIGGVCLNRGCIPTKTLLRSVESLLEVKRSAEFGVTGAATDGAKLDMLKVQARKKDVVGQLVSGVGALLKKNKVTVFKGESQLLDAHTVQVGAEKHESEYIIIATGSSVKHLPIPVDKKAKALTSDDILNLESIPKDAVIIGGGVIGIEFAYFLAASGAKVTVVEFLPNILPMVDEEISARVTKSCEKMGITVYTGAKVTEITAEGVNFELGGEKKTVKTGTVIEAVGRAPDLGGLNLEKAGVKTERGAIVTDEALRTSAANIYAIGDVNGKSMLAHTASAEGIVAAKNIAGIPAAINYGRIPSGIYIHPEVASVGLTENQARERWGGNIKVGKFPILGNGKSKVEGVKEGMIKVILAGDFDEIAGVHIYAPHATDMIAEAVVAMNAEATGEDVADSVHPHPTVSESIMEAFHGALGGAIHF
jgi:dihydrolipoamide dehydrogenase